MSELDQADPREVRYFRTRLTDPSLLDRAVVVEGLLAVPIGSSRRGGYLQLEHGDECARAIARLATLDGFPNLSHEQLLEEGDDGEPVEHHLVCWGDGGPNVPGDDDDAAQGRYYGYSEAAIDRFLNGTNDDAL